MLRGLRIVGTAANAADAIGSISRLQPDIVVLGVNMPDRSGLDVLSEIQQNIRSPIVMMFGSSPSREVRQKCIALGAHQYFDKNLEFNGLLKAVLILIDQFVHLRAAA
jgi:two-component system chemotaxis response regulator CheB